jgi:hypothetical protein
MTIWKIWGGRGVAAMFAVAGTLAAAMWGFILYCRWQSAKLIAQMPPDVREAYLEGLDPESRAESERDMSRFSDK